MPRNLGRRIVFILVMIATATPGLAEEKESPAMKIAIIKADDVREPTEAWNRFIAVSTQRNVNVSCGIICSSLADATE